VVVWDCKDRRRMMLRKIFCGKILRGRVHLPWAQAARAAK